MAPSVSVNVIATPDAVVPEYRPSGAAAATGPVDTTIAIVASARATTLRRRPCVRFIALSPSSGRGVGRFQRELDWGSNDVGVSAGVGSSVRRRDSPPFRCTQNKNASPPAIAASAVHWLTRSPPNSLAGSM